MNNCKLILVVLIQLVDSVPDGSAVTPQVVIHPHNTTLLEDLYTVDKINLDVLDEVAPIDINESECLVIRLVKLTREHLLEGDLLPILALCDVGQEELLGLVLIHRRRGVATVKWIDADHLRVWVVHNVI